MAPDDDSTPISLPPAALGQGERGQLGQVAGHEDAVSAAAGRKRVVVAHQGPDVSAGRIGALGRAAGLHHMHGLACGSGLISRREEPVGVVQPLGIHHDLLGAIVGGQEPDVVAHG